MFSVKNAKDILPIKCPFKVNWWFVGFAAFDHVNLPEIGDCRRPRAARDPGGGQPGPQLQLPAGVGRHLLLHPPHTPGQLLATGEFTVSNILLHLQGLVVFLETRPHWNVSRKYFSLESKGGHIESEQPRTRKSFLVWPSLVLGTIKWSFMYLFHILKHKDIMGKF